MATEIRCDASIRVRDIQGEVLVLDRRTDRVHHFNPTGSLIWRHLEQGSAPEAIVADLVRNFEVSSELAEQDLASFLRVLRDLDLLLPYAPRDFLDSGVEYS